MSVSKVGGLCTINDSADVTMISEDGVIAEMIIEVDENEPEANEQFAFELDEDDDCVELYSSGFASPRNRFIGHSEANDWMYNRGVLFDEKHINGEKEISTGLCNLNLLGKSDVSHDVPVTKSIVGSENKGHDCAVMNDACDFKRRRRTSKKLPLPKSSMVTRGKAASHKTSEDIPREEVTSNQCLATENETSTVELSSQEGNNATQNREKIVTMESPTSCVAEKGSELNKVCDPTTNDQMNEMSCELPTVNEETVAEQHNVSDCSEKLGDIPFIQQIIQNARRLGLRGLYKLTCGHRIPKDMEVMKARLLQFSGFPFGENSVEYVRKTKMLKMFPDAAIKQICHILGTQLGVKDDMIHGILKFLLKPTKFQSNQFMGACYQPQVKLERLSEEYVKFKTVEGKITKLLVSSRKEDSVKKHRKRKLVIQNSDDVRITRSAKRLMEHSEENKEEETGENTVTSSSDSSSSENSLESTKVQGGNSSYDSEGSVNSRNKKKVKAKKREFPCDITTQEDSDEETESDEGLDFHSLQDTSDEERSSVKGAQGLRLGDFQEIRQNIEKCDTKALHRLHTVLYSRLDKPENWKKNILRFSGFDFKCVSTRWRRKEFVLSLMSVSKLKEIADVLHLQYFSARSHKALTLNIMKFLSKPRKGMLKHSRFSSERRGRRKVFRKLSKQTDSSAELCEGNISLEVESLLQDIRRKRQSSLCADPSTESDLPIKNACAKYKKKKLGDIPNVQFMVITSNFEDIDNLHQLLFLQSGPKAKIRRNVQNFDGFIFGPGSFSYKIRIKLLNKMGYEVAKRIAFFLGLTSLGTTIPQQDLNDLIMHFLMCPSDIKCKSIKAYPKDFFNNYTSKSPVLDMASIRNAVKKKVIPNGKSVKDVELHNEMSQETNIPECEKSTMKSDISEDYGKKVIKTEAEDQYSDTSVTSLTDENVISNSNNSVILQCEDSKKITNIRRKRQKRKVPLINSSRIGKRKSTFARRKVNTSVVSKEEMDALKKEIDQCGNDVKSEADDSQNKQFLFRFDPTNEFDSKKLLEHLNKESKNLAKKVKDRKTQVKDPAQTVLPNVPLKITSKPELSGSPKVISILLPPPPQPQSPQKSYVVASDLNSQTNSGSSKVDCAPSLQNIQISSSSSIASHPEGKLPIPPLPKNPLLNLIPQSIHSVLPSTTSLSSATPVKVSSSVMENRKGSQIEGVIRLPQNFVIGQNNVQSSRSNTASDVLSLPEVQKCLQRINTANGGTKHVQMIKIAGNNAVPFQRSTLNMGGGRVYVIPVKPNGHQFSSLPLSAGVTPLQLSNHVVVPSSIESGTPLNIPQLIQVAKNYSRTIGTTALPVSNVTVAKMKPDLSSLHFPIMSTGQCVLPVSIASNSNMAPLSVMKTSNSGKDQSQTEQPPVLIKSTKLEAVKSEETESVVKQEKADRNSDSELDEEPLSHLVGHPSDDMLLQNVKDIVTGADLSSITMRNVLQKVFDKYPQYDLTYRKSFLKDTVKKVICKAPAQTT